MTDHFGRRSMMRTNVGADGASESRRSTAIFGPRDRSRESLLFSKNRPSRIFGESSMASSRTKNLTVSVTSELRENGVKNGHARSARKNSVRPENTPDSSSLDQPSLVAGTLGLPQRIVPKQKTPVCRRRLSNSEQISNPAARESRVDGPCPDRDFLRNLSTTRRLSSSLGGRLAAAPRPRSSLVQQTVVEATVPEVQEIIRTNSTVECELRSRIEKLEKELAEERQKRKSVEMEQTESLREIRELKEQKAQTAGKLQRLTELEQSQGDVKKQLAAAASKLESMHRTHRADIKSLMELNNKVKNELSLKEADLVSAREKSSELQNLIESERTAHSDQLRSKMGRISALESLINKTKAQTRVHHEEIQMLRNIQTRREEDFEKKTRDMAEEHTDQVHSLEEQKQSIHEQLVKCTERNEMYEKALQGSGIDPISLTPMVGMLSEEEIARQTIELERMEQIVEQLENSLGKRKKEAEALLQKQKTVHNSLMNQVRLRETGHTSQAEVIEKVDLSSSYSSRDPHMGDIVSLAAPTSPLPLPLHARRWQEGYLLSPFAPSSPPTESLPPLPQSLC